MRLNNLIKKLINSSRFTSEGIIAVWRRDSSFRLEVFACFILIPLAFILSSTKVETLLLILLLLLLLVIELINSAIEVVVDRISTEIHPLSKIAKDACCAAVGMVILMNVIAWLFVVFMKP